MESGRGPYPVPDPLHFLLGTWAVCRRLVDRVGGEQGSFRGRAVFSLEDADGTPGLCCVEVGELSWPRYRDEARRVTRYRWHGPGRLGAAFEDGRPFHDLDLRTGSWVAEHRCDPDHYRGHFVVSSHRRFQACWEVVGPAKSLQLESRYLRVSKGGSAAP